MQHGGQLNNSPITYSQVKSQHVFGICWGYRSIHDLHVSNRAYE